VPGRVDLGQQRPAPAGEGTADGWTINVSSGVATVEVNAPSYGSIDTVRITRTISTSQVAGSLARSAHHAQPRVTR
jgi:hypothetical protein